MHFLTLEHNPSVSRFTGRRILVVGDVMLDTFVYGDAARISPEAPIPVVRIARESVMPGGAGNVARGMAALGGEAVLVGLVGDDDAGARLRAAIGGAAGIRADLVTDGRPTTQKIRYVAAGQQMLRADVERTDPADPAPLMAAVARHLEEVDAVVLSDYAKGVLTPALLADVIAAARAAGRPVIADPKSADVARYDGVTLVTPNAQEAAAATGIACDGDDAGVAAAAARLLAAMPATPAVLVTRGPRGMTLARRDAPALHLPALARAVFDVSGAGDTVVATLALSLAAGMDAAAATGLANVAAGLAVGKPGTAVVTAGELADALHADGGDEDAVGTAAADLDTALAVVARWRREGARIGFTNGCFDLLHPGHVAQLAQARRACDRLVVGLNADASVRRLKGPTRPVQDAGARAAVLAGLRAVDLVVPFDEDTPLALIAAIRPDVLVKGRDYAVEQVVGADIVLGYGGQVVLADLVPGHSTTGIVAKLAGEAA